MSIYHLFSEGDLGGLASKLKDRETKARAALAAALNKAARESVRLSTAEWNAFATTNKSYIKDKLDIVSGATETRLQAKVWARSRATRANNFKHTVMPSRKGVKLNVKRGSSGAVLKNAFVVTAKSDGKALILERLKKHEKGNKGFKKGEFKAVYGPSINQHFTDSRERVAPQALSAAKQQFMDLMRG